MFSTGDLSVDIVMVTIKKQEGGGGGDPRSVWFNGNILVVIVTSRQNHSSLGLARSMGMTPFQGGTKLEERVY